MHNALTFRLLIINLLFLVVPTFIWLGFLFEETRETNIKNALYHVQTLADARASKIEERIATGKDTLVSIINILNLREPQKINKEKLHQDFQRIIAKASLFEHIFYTEKTPEDRFIVVASNDFQHFLPLDVTNQHFLTASLANSENVTLGFGPEGRPYAFVTQIIQDSEGTITGALTLAYNPHLLLTRVRDVEYQVLDLHFALFTRSGISFAEEDAPNFEMHTFFPIHQEQIDELSLAHSISYKDITYFPVHIKDVSPFGKIFRTKWDGDSRLGLFWPIPRTNTMLVGALSEKALLTPFYKHVWQSLIIGTIACAIASFLLWILVKRLSLPLTQFMNVIHHIESKNFETRFNPDSVGYEINDLGEGINTMLSNLLVQIKTVREEPIKQEIATKELKIGHQIQQRILPQKLPEIEHFLFAATAKPSLEVGGDFYDIFTFQDNQKKRLFITIADGAGKGISACLFSLSLRSMLRSCAIAFHEIPQMIRSSNQLFCQDATPSAMFVTVFAGNFDLETLKFNYYSAGHLPVLLKRKNQNIQKLWNSGQALGIPQERELIEQSIQLQIGDILLFYTDGITEAMNAKGEFFGEKKLIDFLEAATFNTPQALLDALLEEVETFEEEAKQNDDITAVVVYLV